MKKTTIFIWIIIILSFALGAYLYPSMPDKMASHWNAAGEVDGYMSKFWGLFLLPVISLAVYLLLKFIPRLDPLKANIESFSRQFEWFIILIELFFVLIYYLTLFYNLGYRFNMTLLIVPALAVLFYYSGVLMEKVKRNYFIGIRTPWTLQSDEVWDKTHHLGGKLFKAAAILSLLSLFITKWAIFVIIGSVVLASLISIVYSYLVFKKLNP